MTTMEPEEAVQAFFETFNQGEVEAVVALYEPGAAMVAQPGRVVAGHPAIRESLNQFFAMKPTLTLEKSSVVTAGDIALSIAQWSLEGTGPDGAPLRMAGTASDVLRRQADGRWLFVIDNPWGAGALG